MFRGLRRMFTAAQASASSDIIPVVTVDDWTKGPYPACQLWHGFAPLAAVAAQFSYFLVRNASANSAVVIVDDLTFIFGVVADIRLGIFQAPAVGAAATQAAFSRNTDLDGFSALPIELNIADVEIGVINNGVASGAQQIAVNDILAHTITGPWILGKGGQLSFRPSVVNCSMQVYAKGRYYPVIG